MTYESSPVKAPQLSRRRMIRPHHSSFEEKQAHFEVEDQMWSARDRTIIAKTNQYLEESKSLKVEIEELESLLGLGDTDVDFRRILEEARDGKGCATCETFSSEGPSEFLVVSRTLSLLRGTDSG